MPEATSHQATCLSQLISQDIWRSRRHLGDFGMSSFARACHVRGLQRVPVVAILLGTKDGDRFLGEQLASYQRQTMRNWELHVSDDGSTDCTVSTIQNFARGQSRKVTWRVGPRQGYARNYMSLALDESIIADCFAFSDQDDIWKEAKLDQAMRWLASVPAGVPAVYFSRTELIDAKGRHLGYSPLFRRVPSFRNALVQNIGGGNTMVFNLATRRLLIDWGLVEIVSHDWWLYQIVTGAGGIAHYDPAALVQYRQHDHNLVGANAGWRARLTRLKMIMGGRLRRWNAVNLEALKIRETKLSLDSQATLRRFRKAREGVWLLRPYRLFTSGIYRQSTVDCLGMYLAALFKRI
jgi:glycosyltransferase involved in cell wall biosynthesis